VRRFRLCCGREGCRKRNVGVVLEGAAFAAQLERVFRDGFGGAYAEVVDPERTYEAPKVDEKPTAPH
jgi:hypothetical protein